MAGQTLGYAGLRDKLPLHGRTDINVQKTPACSAALGQIPSDRHRRPRHLCAAISGNAAPKTTIVKQQAPPIYQSEDSGLSDTAPEEPDDASRSEDNVICTFRWPAALPGQDVGVVGPCAINFVHVVPVVCMESAIHLPSNARSGSCPENSNACRVLYGLAKPHRSTEKLRKQ